MDAKFAAWMTMFVMLTLMVCGGFYILAFTPFPETNRELAFMAYGTTLAKWGDSIAYLINSTKGSADKNEMLLSKSPTEG